MDQNERRIIDDLFARLGEAERRAGPRDAEAERSIQGHLGRQPAAPYYMAQAIVVQQEALAGAQARHRAARARAQRAPGRRRLPRRPVRRRRERGAALPERPTAARPAAPGGAPGRGPTARAAASSPARRRPRWAWRAACWSPTRSRACWRRIRRWRPSPGRGRSGRRRGSRRRRRLVATQATPASTISDGRRSGDPRLRARPAGGAC